MSAAEKKRLLNRITDKNGNTCVRTDIKFSMNDRISLQNIEVLFQTGISYHSFQMIC